MSENEGLISAASALIGDPALFGRVHDDGTVYVWTAAGEKPVGSYPGKSPEEALQYFVRKFETLASEIALTAARVRSGAILPQDGEIAVAKLRDSIATINAVGDLAALAIAVEQIPPLIDQQRQIYAAKKAEEANARATARNEAKIAKEAIVVESESIADKDSWKVTGDRLKELLDQWKVLPRIDKASDEQLWKRFSVARNGFDRRRRAHFAKLVAEQSTIASAKEKIVTEAETLATSRDWVATARRFSTLMQEWKTSGRGQKRSDDALWERFRAAQEAFFAAKKADLERRENSMGANLAKKEEIAKQIEALLPITDFPTAKKSFRDLLSQLEKVGQIPRDKRDALEIRVGAVEKEIRILDEEHRRKTDPAAKARASDVVRQLTEAIENYEKVAAKATANNDAKRAADASESAEARRSWLAEAQRSLAEFSA